MSSLRIPGLATAVVAFVVMAAPAASGQVAAGGPSGPDLFHSYCATCHGTGGHGDGPLASSLRTRPPDLTLLAKRNGGVFNPDQVAQIIDGRNPVKGHGGGEMPVWGEIFAKSIDPTPVAEKIRRVVGHLESMQQR